MRRYARTNWDGFFDKVKHLLQLEAKLDKDYHMSTQTGNKEGKEFHEKFNKSSLQAEKVLSVICL